MNAVQMSEHTDADPSDSRRSENTSDDADSRHCLTATIVEVATMAAATEMQAKSTAAAASTATTVPNATTATTKARR